MDQTNGGAPLIATTADDANRQQLISNFFNRVGDILSGVDSSPRYEPGMVHNGGLLGPSVPQPDIGVGYGGEVYNRGQAGQIGQAAGGTVQSIGGVQLTPTVMLVLAGVAVFLLMRKR